MDTAIAANIASRAARRLQDLLYPPRCVGCGRFGDRFFCAECGQQTKRPEGDGYCPRCASPLDDGGACSGCINWDALAGCRAAFMHEGSARQAVHALKYGYVRAIASDMATEMRNLADALVADVAFAVPLHRSRVRRRGYNQSAEILKKLGMPTGDGLSRMRKTRTQVGLDASERRANVRGAFAYSGTELNGKRVVLVDDVVTSGATANECARVLREHGAVRVHVVAFVRAHPHRAGSDA